MLWCFLAECISENAYTYSKNYFEKVHVLKFYYNSVFLNIHRELHIVNISHFNDCVKNKSKQFNNNDILPQGLSWANTTTKQQRATITFMVMRHGLKMFGNISGYIISYLSLSCIIRKSFTEMQTRSRWRTYCFHGDKGIFSTNICQLVFDIKLYSI